MDLMKRLFLSRWPRLPSWACGRERGIGNDIRTVFVCVLLLLLYCNLVTSCAVSTVNLSPFTEKRAFGFNAGRAAITCFSTYSTRIACKKLIWHCLVLDAKGCMTISQPASRVSGLQAFLCEFLDGFTSTPESFKRLYRTRVLSITPEVRYGTICF